ncbi:MAG: hypothetical protein KF850_34935 [Labilithrix sp.]|nr:hypothetical protein [Labilithrix sp.]
MLSRRALALLALPVFALLGPVAACGDDPTVDPGGSDPDGGAANPDGSSVDATGDGVPYPKAKGDPCRGQPLPDDQHYAPEGMCARLVSAATNGLRQIMFAPNGDMFGQSNSGKIWLFRDEDDDGFFTKDEIHEWADTGGNGNNAHVDVEGGYVYAGASGGVKRFAYDPGALEGGEAEDVVVNQPGGGHPKHTVRVYDGFLYVHSGSVGNATHETNSPDQYDTRRSLIKRFELSKLTPGTPFEWDAGEPFTLGLRNANGVARNELTKKIYAVVNGLDNQQYKGANVTNDNPGEQVVEIAKDKKYGYPFCFTAQRIEQGDGVVAPGTQLWNAGYQANGDGDAWCAANSEKPTTFLQAHTAPLDLAFFDEQAQGVLPEKWRGGAFIALHGSWNRAPATGYSVIWQPFNPDGTAPMPTSTKDTTTFPYVVVFGAGTVAGGPEDKPWSWSDDSAGEAPRPAGVAVNPIDGALYIASDTSGYVYRVGVKQ